MATAPAETISTAFPELSGATTIHNLATAPLVEKILLRGEAQLASNGAIVARTGKFTGRTPPNRFIVKQAATDSTVAWGKTNQAISPASFEKVRRRMAQYLQGKELLVQDAFGGSDPKYRLKIRVVTELAWHSLFAHQLFLRPTAEELAEFVPDFTLVDLPGCQAVPSEDGTASGTFILLDFERKLILIGGTFYAGEIKKSVFSILNFLLPSRGVFPMHCSANVGPEGDTAIFFGLSGTGKTTLSADAARQLIGDDEHGWGDNGVFNFEGGCYAKCIRLSRAGEPQIWDAIRFGSVLENVKLDPATHVPDYDDDSLTENSRAAYPVDFISNALLSGRGPHPKNVVMLTADAFGVMPPIARLSIPQAMFHFLSGYTAKLAGTEIGVTEPKATFSTCFGEPFLPLDPMKYAQMLGDKVQKHQAKCWLINTGWTGGAYGVGTRMKLAYTRAMVNAALSGQLDKVKYHTDPVFGLEIPDEVPGVPANVLQPRSTWKDGAEYDKSAQHLAGLFRDNFKRFPNAAKEIVAAGPRG